MEMEGILQLLPRLPVICVMAEFQLQDTQAKQQVKKALFHQQLPPKRIVWQFTTSTNNPPSSSPINDCFLIIRILSFSSVGPLVSFLTVSSQCSLQFPQYPHWRLSSDRAGTASSFVFILFFRSKWDFLHTCSQALILVKATSHTTFSFPTTVLYDEQFVVPVLLYRSTICSWKANKQTKKPNHKPDNRIYCYNLAWFKQN